MKNSGWFEQLIRQRFRIVPTRSIVGICGLALATLTPGAISAQVGGVPIAAPETHVSAPDGYSIHHSIDLGGHYSNVDGSAAMYDTLVNEHSGPRVLGETIELHALPGKKTPWMDDLKGFTSGFGGDSNNLVRMDFSKKKQYEFSGLFRRDRQYFDYDLMGNPNIPSSYSISNMAGGVATPKVSWGHVSHSPEMFNTVRHMLDTKVTLKPQSVFTGYAGYAQNIFQGPTLSPAYNVGKYNALLQQFQRNSTDEFNFGVDWKPSGQTKVSFEEVITHYKNDSYFTLDPNGFKVQEADGTPVYLGSWNSLTPYGYGSAASSACDTSAMGTAYTNANNYTLITSSGIPGSLPVINAACSAVSSYLRTQPTRVITPTEILRVQSSAIKNIVMNGDFRYTLSNMNMPHYYESIQGLDYASTTNSLGAVRSIVYSGGSASGHRSVVSADYGIIWQPTHRFSLADAVNFSNTQQPGSSYIPVAVSLSTPSLATGTINYAGTLTSSNIVTLPHGINGTLTPDFFGQRIVTNNATASWDATNWSRYSLTYRFSTKYLDRGTTHGSNMAAGSLTDPVSGALSFNENGGIFNAAIRPRNNLDLNGTVEAFYDDNVLTALSPRQTRHYRVHAKYHPLPWAIIVGSYNDLERHNNTSNNVASATAYPNYGQLKHEDHSRTASLSASINPKESYGFDVYYAYSDVYTSTNTCYTSGAAAATASTVAITGTATLTSSGAPSLCNATTPLWKAADFSDAPTHYGSASMTVSPVKDVHSNFGYQISHVAGSQFYSTPQQVNGSLDSDYQTPFLNVAWQVHPGLIWKAEYKLFRYNEFGASGPKYCVSPTGTAPLTTVVSCTSLSIPTGLTEGVSGLTDPRTFTANNLTMGIHYEF